MPTALSSRILLLPLQERLEADPDDAVAWAELLRLYAPKLRALIHSRDAGRYADDILQQVWFRFYLVLRKRRLNGPFEPLLVTATINVIKSTLQSEAKHDYSPLEEEIYVPSDLRGETEQTVLRSDLEAFFIDYLKTVGDTEQRELKQRRLKAFELRIYNDMKYKEIALELGVPENTVSTWIKRLREQFMQWRS